MYISNSDQDNIITATGFPGKDNISRENFFLHFLNFFYKTIKKDLRKDGGFSKM